MSKSPVFEKTYEHYLNQVSGLDLESIQDRLGIGIKGESATIDFFGRSYLVSKNGVSDRSGKKPALDVCVVLCRYLIMCPPVDPNEDDWASFRDFKDSSPLTAYYENEVQNKISRFFSGKSELLKQAGNQAGGYLPKEHPSYDVALQFDALPRISLLLLFNDADEDFPAKCSVLFQKSAESYLDAECLAILGYRLGRYIKEAALS